MSKLNNEGLTEEESGVFKDLMYIAAKNNNGNIPKDVVENIQLMKKNISNINTTAGRKYALSVLLNDPRFGFDKDIYFNNSNCTYSYLFSFCRAYYEALWSYKWKYWLS